MQALVINIGKTEEVKCLVSNILSFKPFLQELSKRSKKRESVKNKFYKYILDTFEKNLHLIPSLSPEETTDFQELLDYIYTTVSPLMEDEENFFWALGTPVPTRIFYGTDAFYNLYKKHASPNKKDAETLLDFYQRYQEEFVYKLILEKLYQFPSFFRNEMTYAYTDPEQNLQRYFKVHTDTRFVTVGVKGKLPALDFKTIEPYFYEGTGFDLLNEMLPQHLFEFEGFSILTLEDITPLQTLENIRSAIGNNNLGQGERFRNVIQSLKILVEDNQVEFGLLPFLKVNNRFVYEDSVCSSNILIKSALRYNIAEESFNSLVSKYVENPKAAFFNKLNEKSPDDLLFLKVLKDAGVQSYAVLPVTFSNNLVGVIEIYATCDFVFYEKLLSRLDAAIPLVGQLLKQTIDDFNNRIEAVIKNKFTSLQQAVQWKFNEVAWSYLKKKPGNSPVETVSFKNVYPLYGAIDIRNSTIERNKALQEDLSTNLNLLVKTLASLKKHIHLELIDELIFNTRQWLDQTSESITSANEIQLTYFLQNEINPFLNHCKTNKPETQKIINSYLQAVDENTGKAFSCRRNLENSMQLINLTVSDYFEKKQQELQDIYPFYFEKFRTDGVEYDIYIGQSLAPEKAFNLFYLKNLRLWQLKSMVEIARLTHSLLSQMSRPLETTQLIFVHGGTIDISFRNDERRFDVEGAYNIRYEIIKKRIDKVHIKDTGERLTQPGKIALVYNQNNAEEYLSDIEYLQAENFLSRDIEEFDLEELQGVTGLRALRVSINPEPSR